MPGPPDLVFSRIKFHFQFDVYQNVLYQEVPGVLPGFQDNQILFLVKYSKYHKCIEKDFCIIIYMNY